MEKQKKGAICKECRWKDTWIYDEDHEIFICGTSGLQGVGDDDFCSVGEAKEDMHISATVEWMSSEDYKERFKAEYWQTKLRYKKLHEICVKMEAGTLDFTPSCSKGLLETQKSHMGNYLKCLEVRAELEGIEL